MDMNVPSDRPSSLFVFDRVVRATSIGSRTRLARRSPRDRFFHLDLQVLHDPYRIEAELLELRRCACLGFLRRLFVRPNRCGHDARAIDFFVDETLHQTGKGLEESDLRTSLRNLLFGPPQAR
jgi:hypothetical protein